MGAPELPALQTRNNHLFAVRELKEKMPRIEQLDRFDVAKIDDASPARLKEKVFGEPLRRATKMLGHKMVLAVSVSQLGVVALYSQTNHIGQAQKRTVRKEKILLGIEFVKDLRTFIPKRRHRFHTRGVWEEESVNT